MNMFSTHAQPLSETLSDFFWNIKIKIKKKLLWIRSGVDAGKDVV